MARVRLGDVEVDVSLVGANVGFTFRCGGVAIHGVADPDDAQQIADLFSGVAECARVPLPARPRCSAEVDGGRCAGLEGHDGEHYANARDRGAL